jgi:glyoxylase-like metal-dependent hydrolase (beta-lactamase superfamily II)
MNNTNKLPTAVIIKGNFLTSVLTIVFTIVFTMLFTLAPVGQANAQQEQPTRSITEIATNLYWAQNNNHHAVFLVTDDGVILADTINRDFSTWLKAELEERFSAQVKYVLYSHHHWDHSSGGAVFEDTAQFVSHANMPHRLALPPADTALPANAASLDANGNGQLERSETSGNFQNNFALYDADGDDVISAAEATRGALNDVRAPDLLYQDKMTITLGGQNVELIYTGDMTHTDDMSIIRFPAQNTIFVVDWISPRRLPFRTLGVGKLDGWLNALRFAEALEYDIAAGSHGVVGSKTDVTDLRHYLEELRELVSDGIAAGQSLEEMQASITMKAYSNWIRYEDWVPLNVQGMYNMLTQ